MSQPNDDLAKDKDDKLDDLENEFKDDDELWGEWTENPDVEDGSVDPKNLDDFYSKDDE